MMDVIEIKDATLVETMFKFRNPKPMRIIVLMLHDAFYSKLCTMMDLVMHDYIFKICRTNVLLGNFLKDLRNIEEFQRS